MAETTTVEVANLVAVPQVVMHSSEMNGRIRPLGMTYLQVGAGSVADTIVLAKLDPGIERLYLPQWYLKYSAGGGTATLAIGWRAYTDLDGNVVAESVAGIRAATSVVAAGDIIGAEWAGVVTNGVKEFQSREGVEIFATVAGSGLPDAMTIAGYGFHCKD